MWRAKAPLQEAAAESFSRRQFVMAVTQMSFDIRVTVAQKANKRGRYSQRAARNPSEAKGILVRPRIKSFSEPIMPAYEICYLDQDGSLTYKFSATCDEIG